MPKEVIIDPFDGGESGRSGSRGAQFCAGVSGKRRNATDKCIWSIEDRFFAPAGRRYAPLVIGWETTRSGLLQRADTNPGGSTIKVESHL